MWEEGALPPHVEAALHGLSIVGAERELNYVRAFIRQWGGLGPDAMALALPHTTGDERLFVLLTLGHSRARESSSLLLPFLQSAEPLERWASAIGLGQLREKQAVPVLCAMLAEFLPESQEEYLAAADSRYEFWRDWAPLLLEALGEPEAVPPLRRALSQLIRVLEQEVLSEPDAAVLERASLGREGLTMEDVGRIQAIMDRTNPPMIIRYGGRDEDQGMGNAEGDSPFSEPNDLVQMYKQENRWHSGELGNLVHYQDEVIFALGRLGALGGLTGLRAAEPFLHVWMVHLLMGYLHNRYSAGDVSGKLSAKLKADIEQKLLQVFGLTPEEQALAMGIYVRSKLGGVLMRYLDEQSRNQESVIG